MNYFRAKCQKKPAPGVGVGQKAKWSWGWVGGVLGAMRGSTGNDERGVVMRSEAKGAGSGWHSAQVGLREPLLEGINHVDPGAVGLG